MAKQSINLGSSANDGTGTTLRAGGDLVNDNFDELYTCLLYTSPSPRDKRQSRMPSSA